MEPRTFQSTSAQATTAYESRFRIDYPLAPARDVRVIALDSGAESIVRQASGLPWNTARFFVCGSAAGTDGSRDSPDDVNLSGLDSRPTSLTAELVGAGAAIVVATTDARASAAAIIGAACTVRGIMTAGIVVGTDTDSYATVAALRPYARVLIVSNDENDLVALLSALRA